MEQLQNFRRRPLIIGEARPPGVSRPFDYFNDRKKEVRTTLQLLRMIYNEKSLAEHKKLLIDFSLVNCLDCCLGDDEFKKDLNNFEKVKQFLEKHLVEAGDFTPESDRWPLLCHSEDTYDMSPAIPLLYGRAVFIVGGALEAFEAAFQPLERLKSWRMRGDVNFVTVAPSLCDSGALEITAQLFFLTHPSGWDRQYRGSGPAREHLPTVQALFKQARCWNRG